MEKPFSVLSLSMKCFLSPTTGETAALVPQHRFGTYSTIAIVFNSNFSERMNGCKEVVVNLYNLPLDSSYAFSQSHWSLDFHVDVALLLAALPSCENFELSRMLARQFGLVTTGEVFREEKEGVTLCQSCCSLRMLILRRSLYLFGLYPCSS